MAKRTIYKVNSSRAKETKQRLQEEAQRNLLPMWKIPEGNSKIRILPPWSEAGDIAFECRSHWNIPPNDRMVNCLTVINKECPLCELTKELRGRGKDALASKFSAKKSIYYNIIVRGEEEKGVQIMRSGIQLYENILSYLYDEDYGDITDVDEGRDVTIERTGQKLDTSYVVKVSPNNSTLSDDPKQSDAWIDGMFELDGIMDFKDAFELKDVVNNITGEKTNEVPNEVPTLIDTSAKEVDNVEENKEVDVSAEDRKAKLLKELESLV